MQTRKQKVIAKNLRIVLDTYSESHKVENRYRTIRKALEGNWFNLISSVSKETMCDFIRDVVYLDRKLRQMTEGEDDDKKKELAQQAQADLGYTAGYRSDLKKLSTL